MKFIVRLSQYSVQVTFQSLHANVNRMLMRSQQSNFQHDTYDPPYVYKKHKKAGLYS